MKPVKILLVLSIIFLAAFSFSYSEEEGLKYFGFEDVMKFETLRGRSISDEGNWAGFYSKPDRGDTKAFVVSTGEDSVVFEIKNGLAPHFSNNERWVAVTVTPSSIEQANKKRDETLDNKMALLKTSSGDIKYFDAVEEYHFSENSAWLAYKIKGGASPDKKFQKRPVGGELVLRRLVAESQISFQHVTHFKFDSLSNSLAFVVAEPDGKKNGLFYINLESDLKFPIVMDTGAAMHYSELAWSRDGKMLAYVAAKEGEEGEPDSCAVRIWEESLAGYTEIINDTTAPENWFVPFKNELNWAESGERLFFGIKPYSDTIPPEQEITFTDSTFYDKETIIKESEVDVWHWKDPLIKTNRKLWWGRHKDRVFKCVYHMNLNKYIQLADLELPVVDFTDSPNFTLGLSDTPYLREITWDGWYYDVYRVNVINGERKLIEKRTQYEAELSPGGNYICYYKDKHWYLHNCNTDSTKNATNQIEVNFYDEDWDMPAAPAPYGFAGWTEGGEAFLVYDKFDLWRIFTDGDGLLNQTAAEGRLTDIRFRLRVLDEDHKYFKRNKQYLLSGFNEKTKRSGIYKIGFNMLGVERYFSGDSLFRLYDISKKNSKILYSVERYDLFPDLHVTDTTFAEVNRLTDYQKQLEPYNWGSAELIEWKSYEGDTLQGFYIKPDNYSPDKRYPVIIYFYEELSDRLHRFETPGNHHRPCFPTYVSDGYVMFFPDVKFREGYPGESSLNALLSGSRKLAEIGVADTSRIALWGHSWSGYQASYIVTKSDFFNSAVAGAPVSNMTSAYSGIRRGTGLARQFQYEKWQSRIGGTIWDSLDAYIRNSPIFFAQNMNTPLLIEFGDLDDAVPWEQGIELYLALRRLDKNVIFLQYRNEPHHPRKYANKLDYAIKMKQFYDYYLKGKKAPDWITKGIEYKGR